MAKILNLVIEDHSDPRKTAITVESFLIREGVQDPEKALRAAVKEYVSSGTEESKHALEYACGYFNWGDAISSIPSSLFKKHGLTMFNQDAADVFVDHDEVLCADSPDEAEEGQ